MQIGEVRSLIPGGSGESEGYRIIKNVYDGLVYYDIETGEPKMLCTLLRAGPGEQIRQPNAGPLCISHRAMAPLNARHPRAEQRPAVPGALEDRLHGHLLHRRELGEGELERLIDQPDDLEPPCGGIDRRMRRRKVEQIRCLMEKL